MIKAELRSQFRAKRLELSDQELISKSRLIASRAISGIDWDIVKSAHCYHAMTRAKEVLTQGIEEWMRRRGIYVINPGNELTLEEMTHKYDLIVVPILAFDRSLQRIGYGGGFYDRLLISQPQALKVGLAYDLSLAQSPIPVEPHDQPLDLVFTESAYYSRELP
jgi:5-formyltetrahydrofolate cyclo-ligase